MNTQGSENALSLEARPYLANFVRMQFDKARGDWVLQAPERVLVLDETSKEILDRCSGQVSLGEVIQGLAKEFDAPRDIITHDVLAVLGLLLEKGFLEISPPQESD